MANSHVLASKASCVAGVKEGWKYGWRLCCVGLAQAPAQVFARVVACACNNTGLAEAAGFSCAGAQRMISRRMRVSLCLG